jgi:hypothetical protein
MDNPQETNYYKNFNKVGSSETTRNAPNIRIKHLG